MENTRVRALAFVLLFLSGTVSAAVSIRTVDLNGGGIFEDVDGRGYTDLQHKYIFDLPQLPPMYQNLVTAGVTFDLRATNDPSFTVMLYDSDDHLLSTATVSDDPNNPNENGRMAILFRYLPPEKDYYALVTGHSDSDVSHRVFLYIQTPTIPEPQTYAMFIVGLGLLGWHLRRSKNNKTIVTTGPASARFSLVPRVVVPFRSISHQDNSQQAKYQRPE